MLHHKTERNQSLKRLFEDGQTCFTGGRAGGHGGGAWQLLTFEFFTVGDINPGVPNSSKSIIGNQPNYKLIIIC